MLLSDKYPFLTNYFTAALTSADRPLPQSIVFYGNDLPSQYALSMEIARLLNCKEGKTDDCQCLNCKWIRENSHPAVMTISRLDNKPEDDESKTVISIKQSAQIKESLVSASEFHRVFIFCDRDENNNIAGLNKLNFQDETANSLLKIIEEPQAGITFIFLTRYIDDLLPTIISRSQCFFVPSNEPVNYNYSSICGVFEKYWEFDKNKIFDISENLQKLAAETSVESVLDAIQNYILHTLKLNTNSQKLINDIKSIEECRTQAKLGIKPVNIFDNLCLSLIGN